ncbi:hypothetical protein [Flavobacterium aquicola]|uniref:Uncharacterized protein n=1 Tax=Flavobacterium aquicola TaxID=1682742 RepID=A0A3E0ES89_9FLAO|nr:hypothetical protein [Flavobacterium aquicola]REH00996.1 hypothetical protein C8P67_102249 [Flavobacterium aquicola]
MKTSKKLSYPKLENEFLENILGQLVNQYTIVQIFFTKQEPPSLNSHLVINICEKIDAEQLQQKKWITKVRDRYQINVYFIYSGRLHHRFSFGHPFIEFYCQPSALIYQNEDSVNPLIIKRSWKKYSKKFNVFAECFYHDHDLYKSQVKNLISEGASKSVFTSYERLIVHDLEYLEELYSGSTSTSLDLNESINNLIQYIPEIQKCFVKNSRSKYYLADLFAKAKEATTDDDVIHKNEMYEALGIAEQNLYCMIEKRFGELKKLIKKRCFEKQEVLYLNDNVAKDEIIDITIETILKSVEAEQIYLYHQIANHDKTTYYLMLIAVGAGNDKLKLINQSLKSKMEGKYDFVLISHNRSWIQNSLYQHQSFFSKIIQNKYLIYSSSEYLPEFHWEIPHNPSHADLHFYYKPAKDTAMQFFKIVEGIKENYQGLDSLFTLFFMSFCRTYIFCKTYYLPNYLSNQTLWQLCLYADSNMRKYNYLIEQFWTDFFPYLDRHMNLRHDLSKLNKEKVDQMNTIVEKLMDELHNLVIEGGLLNSEQD